MIEAAIFARVPIFGALPLSLQEVRRKIAYEACSYA